MKCYHLQQHGWTQRILYLVNKSNKDNYYMIPLICGIQKIIQICIHVETITDIEKKKLIVTKNGRGREGHTRSMSLINTKNTNYYYT